MPTTPSTHKGKPTWQAANSARWRVERQPMRLSSTRVSLSRLIERCPSWLRPSLCNQLPTVLSALICPCRRRLT
ncbi:hypothetical protein D3C76_1485250 [compost metagenome]